MIVRWTSVALQRRADIIDYIAEDNPNAALALDDAFADAAKMLGKSPHLGRPGRIAGTREWVVRKNYILLYLVEGQEVVMLTVVHGAQKFPPSSFLKSSPVSFPNRPFSGS